jgi:hypothetical protein
MYYRYPTFPSAPHFGALPWSPAAMAYEWSTRPAWRWEPPAHVREIRFLLLWEVQSRLAGIVLLALAASAAFWIGLAVMLPWALLATVVYENRRGAGLPDVVAPPARSETGNKRRWFAYGLKAWLFIGWQPIAYARISGPLLRRSQGCAAARAGRFTALAFGLVFFGVTPAHHLLRKAGYGPRRTYAMNLGARFLNTPFKLAQATLVVAAFSFAFHLPLPGS